ncbi:MAG: purine-nucleoside phosphorylase [Acidimicrobiia bacterium]|nr:purine-nucleoside phosphorylase [Acidimicrobiia bacterium]
MYPNVERRRIAHSEPFGIAEQAAADIALKMGGGPHHVAVILGSGWGEATQHLGDLRREVMLLDLPGFAASTVPGHGGSVRSTVIGDKRVLTFEGRAHLYEGNSTAQVVHAVRTAVMSGCDVVVLTNAAGAVNLDYEVGQGVVISDHLNLTGHSPLWGAPPPRPYAQRFVDLTDAYSPRLRALAKEAAPDVVEGVYAAMHGPHYETPAEIEVLRTMGADLVGMSTVLETIAARHLGAEVLGLSLVTNAAAGVTGRPLDHNEVLDASSEAAERMGELISGVIERL